MKNNALLKCWENYVQKFNKKPWQANQYSRSCSKHFQSTDYILPPSSNNTCRLKKYAFPSGPPVHSDSPTLTTHDEELNRGIVQSMKVLLYLQKKDQDVLRVMTEMNYTPNYNIKIRTLQQKLRRTKKKMNTMHEVIQFLEEKLVLNPKESEALQSTLIESFEKSAQKQTIKDYPDEIRRFQRLL